MKSFGIFYKKEDGQTETVGSSEVQINIWKLTTEGRKSYYVDFGLQFNPSIKEVFVLVPFLTDKNNVKDLGCVISKDSELISRLFNTDTTSNHSAQSSFTPVSKDEGRSFEICALDVDNKTEFEEIKSGDITFTLINFKIPQKTEPEKQEAEKNKTTTGVEKPMYDYYIRFRIIVDSKSHLSTTENVANDVIQSAFSKLELFDVRLNDARYIPSNVSQIIYNDKKCRPFYFQKVHFFYMVDVKESMQTTSPACHDSRFLQYCDWKNYLDSENIKEKNFLSYHWKKVKSEQSKENIKSFQLCYSCLFPDRNTKQLLAYAGMAIILGFFGSMLYFSFSSIFTGIPSWAVWAKIAVILVLILLESIYFIFFNKKS